MVTLVLSERTARVTPATGTASANDGSVDTGTTHKQTYDALDIGGRPMRYV